jgi:hypothetical protein
MPSLRLNIGLNNGRKLPFGGGAAPSGIIASTAGDLIISFGYFSDTQYAKASNTYWDFNYGDGEYQQLTWNSVIANTWVLDVNNGEIRATNPSTNSLIIPTTGWTYTVGVGPDITITAA